MKSLIWADFKFGPLNLWVVWPSPEMVRVNTLLKIYERSMKTKQRMSDAYPLKTLTLRQYAEALKSGMFWEWYPEATGNYEDDCLNKKEDKK